MSWLLLENCPAVHHLRFAMMQSAAAAVGHGTRELNCTLWVNTVLVSFLMIEHCELRSATLSEKWMLIWQRWQVYYYCNVVIDGKCMIGGVAHVIIVWLIFVIIVIILQIPCQMASNFKYPNTSRGIDREAKLWALLNGSEIKSANKTNIIHVVSQQITLIILNS